MIGIYKLTNKYDNKIYIGKSTNIEKRYKAHISRKNDGSYFHNAIRKYGIESFDFDILIECPIENLDYWEAFYIRYYGSNLHDYGYNMTSGGDGGFIRNDESNKKQSESMKGHIPWNKGLKTNKPAWNRGIPATEEQKEKQRQKMIGKISGNKGKHQVAWNKGKKGLQVAWNKGLKKISNNV